MNYKEIQKSLKFMDALGINSSNTPQLRSVQYYTSHEALLMFQHMDTQKSSTRICVVVEYEIVYLSLVLLYIR